MPIYIETPKLLNDEDRQDLDKIYADYPVNTALERLEYLQDPNKSNHWQLYVARFNAKLLGALWLELGESTDTSLKNNPAVIHDICVRKITRRRGVGERLLSVAQAQHSNISIATPPQALEDSQAIVALAKKLNITINK